MKRGYIRRTAPLLRRRTSSRKYQQVHPDDRQTYRAVTERARTPEGYLVCEGCGRSLVDGKEQRHHCIHRSQGGETTLDNILVLCLQCHRAKHGEQLVTGEPSSPKWEDSSPPAADIPFSR